MSFGLWTLRPVVAKCLGRGGGIFASHTPVGRHGAAFLTIPVQTFERRPEVEIINFLFGHAAHKVGLFLLGTETAVVEVDLEPGDKDGFKSRFTFLRFNPGIVKIVADALCRAFQHDAGVGIVGDGTDDALDYVGGLTLGGVLPQSDLGAMGQFQVVGAQRLGILHRADRDDGPRSSSCRLDCEPSKFWKRTGNTSFGWYCAMREYMARTLRAWSF